MACNIHVDEELILPNGFKQLIGSAIFDSSYGGEASEYFNLCNYLNPDCYPLVTTSPAAGYQINHDQGTANAGAVSAYYYIGNNEAANVVGCNFALGNVKAETDLSAVNFRFTAIGKGL